MWVVLIIYLAVMSVHAFVSPGSAQLVLRSSHRARGTTVVQYKVEKNGNKDDGGDEQRPASGWKRFIPGVVRNRLDKRAPDPEMDSSNRYVLFVSCRSGRHTPEHPLPTPPSSRAPSSLCPSPKQIPTAPGEVSGS